jgi:hypothetical protein
LLIGGVPTRDFGNQFGLTLSWAGLARGVSQKNAAIVPSTLPLQGFLSWVDLPDLSLAEWTARILAMATSAALATGGSDPAGYEVYSPYQLRPQSQRNRWASPKLWRPVGKDTPFYWLCRSRAVPRRFWLARLRETRHGPGFDREWPVDYRMVRRLMYGMDQLMGATVTARIAPVSATTPTEREVRLFNWPAWAEYQTLIAVAADVTPVGGSRLPIRLRVADTWFSDVRSALDGLAVRVLDEPNPFPS